MFGLACWQRMGWANRGYTKILDKSDYADSLIPYWEIGFE
jgi:hypothetical protein